MSSLCFTGLYRVQAKGYNATKHIAAPNGDTSMTFKSASIYASISTVVLSGLIYLVQVRGAIWMPSLAMQVLVTICLFPIFTWFVITLPLGRTKPRVAQDGSSYGFIKIGARLSVTALALPLALVSSPPVIWGNDGVMWLLVPLFLLSCYALATIWITRVRWDNDTLIATSPVLLGDKLFQWNTLSDVTIFSKLDYTILKFADGRTAHLGRYMEGYTDVMNIVERHTKNA